MEIIVICIIGAIVAGVSAYTVALVNKTEQLIKQTERQIRDAELYFKHSTDNLADEIRSTVRAMNTNAKNTNLWIKKMQDDVKRAESNTAECMRIHALRKEYESNGE